MNGAVFGARQRRTRMKNHLEHLLDPQPNLCVGNDGKLQLCLPA